jgi:hypothetical protein
MAPIRHWFHARDESPPEMSILRVNLSYVLHEPSTAEAVQRTAEQLRRESSRIERTTRALASLNDEELRARVIAEGNAPETRSPVPSALEVVTFRAGAWSLLPRIMRCTGHTRDDQPASYTCIDDADCRSMATLRFFGAPAALCVPALDSTADRCWAFAAAVIRPGDETVLLRVQLIDARNRDDGLRSVVDCAETTIREFVTQWDAERALWTSPAEFTLPEFTLRGSEQTPCGL